MFGDFQQFSFKYAKIHLTYDQHGLLSHYAFSLRLKITKIIFRLWIFLNQSETSEFSLVKFPGITLQKLEIEAGKSQVKRSRNWAFAWQYLWMISTENGLEHSNNVTLNVCDMTKSVQMRYKAGKVNLLERFWFESITFEHE